MTRPLENRAPSDERPPHDYTAYDTQGRPVAFFEVKRRYDTDANWARAWHQLILERLGNQVHAALLLVTPDRLYSWKAGAQTSEEPKVLQAAPFLEPYFERLKISSAKVDPQVFEEIVGLWLRDVAQHLEPQGNNKVDQELLSLLRGRDVISESGA